MGAPAVGARQQPAHSALPWAGPAPTALTQQRVGGVLSLRGPRFSRPPPPPSRFPLSGAQGARGQVRPPSLRSAVPSRRRREDPEATVPPPGSVSAMNGAGEAPLFPAEALPGGFWGLRCVPEARWRGRAGAGTRGDGGMELSGWAGGARREAASWARTLVKGFSAALWSPRDALTKLEPECRR